MSEPARILIVRLSHLGDVVCSVGMLHALHRAYPNAEIAWAIQPEFAGILDGAPGLARRFTFDRTGGVVALWRLRRELRAFAPDVAIDAQGNLKSALVTWSSGAPRRVSFAPTEWTEGAGALAVNEHAPPIRPSRDAARIDPAHIVERVASLARHVTRDAGVPRTDLFVTEDERERGRRRLDELLGGSAGERPVLVHLTSAEDVRAWPVARWADALRALADRERPVLLLAGPAEARTLAELEVALASTGVRVPAWSGSKSLRELVGLFAAAGERGGVLASADSGPMHVAWASGLRVVVLEGPYDERRSGPWPVASTRASASDRPHGVVRASRPPECAPCLSKRCTHPEGPVCMERISSDELLAALLLDA